MTSSPAYLVSGATGEQGGSVARELLKAGYRVHALVRDASKAQAKELESLGAVLFVGNFSNADVISKATVGVKGVFINPFPDFTNPEGEAETAQRFVDAARAAGTVEHIILSTALHTGSHQHYLSIDPNYPLKQYYHSKAAAEAVVRNSNGVKYWTILRPAWLYQQYTFPYSALHFPQLHTDRILSSPLDHVTPFIHFNAKDMGYWARAAFENPAKFASKEIELGAESLNLEQAVRGLEKVSGVKITTQWLDPAEVAKDTSDPMSGPRATFAVWQKEQGFDLTPEEYDTAKSYGVPLTSFEQWLEQDKAQIFKTLKVSL
ncbi:NAD(P)-binding protein [Exidia glandulosa HHB12029]|uniref:NAD(P)-binding protein n=1 Tax=Exidia glandulosa HHB12029 TaxID=1314781 RepID=A0A165MG74_EXIGL|nr:NAD(P)-binding protein [Exidia glandulosa HHB12029]